MKSFAAVAALAAAVPFVLGQGMQVNSLSGVIECEPVLVSWSGGTPPYYVSFIPGGQPSAAALKQFPPQQGTSFTWTVDMPAGTSFSTELKDATGQPVYSGIQQVEPGTNTSCQNDNVMEGGSSTSAGAAASSQTPGVAAAASTTAMTMTSSSHASVTAPGSSASSGSASTSGSAVPSGSVTRVTAAAQSSATTTSTATATATSTQNAAQGTSINAFGIAGVLGLIGAALF